MCANGIQIALKNYSVPGVLFFETRVVKFSAGADVVNEGDTQAFVYSTFKSLPYAPRVSEVYECFSWNGIHYLVMEKIDLPTMETWINDARSEAEKQSRFDMACEAAANALRYLFTLSPPGGTEIGLIQGAYAQTQSEDIRAEGGCACHPTHEFYLPQALDRRPRGAPPLALNIAHEPLVMVQSDISPCNFLIDPETLHVTIIDFGGISVLPSSFVSLTLHVTRDTFIKGIAKFLGWERSENIETLAAAAGIYSLTSDPRFGLDKEGVPECLESPTGKRRRSAMARSCYPSKV
ncbi:hypothetical protein BT96DRAFT_921545 [Gymnopus androsaceus JB14]|uniref:Aminoglycoside phosphotransferase domain-containing protein n=1 Tax=Gymnopus androsaceus JB14 TaxID=1447944 RepID=A0A6A4HFV4_9AGAR|nr:hypothetical protein BT96DRAFT_921545 [Gymnopus androsaceus JB14]